MHYVQDKDERSRIQSQASMYIQKNPEEAAQTLQELQLASKDTIYLIQKKMLRFGANINGSHTYMAARKKELLSLMDQEGLGTIWWTLSMPTWMWLDLRKLFGEVPDKLDSESDDTYSKRMMSHARDKHLKNPHIVNEFFLRRVANFVQHFFGPNCLESVWTWYRIEWQKRGDPHVHGMASLRNVPNFNFLAKKVTDGRRSLAVLHWIKSKTHNASAEYSDLLQNLTDLPTADNMIMTDVFDALEDFDTGFFSLSAIDQITKIKEYMLLVDAGIQCDNQITCYRDYILTSMNPIVPLPNDADLKERDPHMSTRAEVHPCITCYDDFVKNGTCDLSSPESQTVYEGLLNFCQRHRHNESYCMRNKLCRFNFPKILLSSSVVTVKDILYKRFCLTYLLIYTLT